MYPEFLQKFIDRSIWIVLYFLLTVLKCKKWLLLSSQKQVLVLFGNFSGFDHSRKIFFSVRWQINLNRIYPLADSNCEKYYDCGLVLCPQNRITFTRNFVSNSLILIERYVIIDQWSFLREKLLLLLNGTWTLQRNNVFFSVNVSWFYLAHRSNFSTLDAFIIINDRNWLKELLPLRILTFQAISGSTPDLLNLKNLILVNLCIKVCNKSLGI